MAWFPFVKIDAKAADLLAQNIAIGVDQAVKFSRSGREKNGASRNSVTQFISCASVR